MIISFIGHSKIYKKRDIQTKIEEAILQNTVEDEPIFFYCGGYGDFDLLCLKALLNIKKERRGCQMVLITPYLNTPKHLKDKLDLFDQLIYPPIETVPIKFAIVARNKWMIDKADLIISYINRDYGGAYSALSYAKRKKKRIINLSYCDE